MSIQAATVDLLREGKAKEAFLILINQAKTVDDVFEAMEILVEAARCGHCFGVDEAEGYVDLCRRLMQGSKADESLKAKTFSRFNARTEYLIGVMASLAPTEDMRQVYIDNLDSRFEKFLHGRTLYAKAQAYREGKFANRAQYLRLLKRAFRMQYSLSSEDIAEIGYNVLPKSAFNNLEEYAMGEMEKCGYQSCAIAFEYLMHGDCDDSFDFTYGTLALGDIYVNLQDVESANDAAEDFFNSFRRKDELLLQYQSIKARNYLRTVAACHYVDVTGKLLNYSMSEQKKMLAEGERLALEVETSGEEEADGSAAYFMFIILLTDAFLNENDAYKWYCLAERNGCEIPAKMRQRMENFRQQKLAEQRGFKSNAVKNLKKAAGFFKSLFSGYTDTTKQLDGIRRGVVRDEGRYVYLIDKDTGREHPIYNYDSRTGLFTDKNDNMYEIDLRYPDGAVPNITDLNDRL